MRRLFLLAVACLAVLATSGISTARDQNPYGLRYPYQAGYLFFPEDDGGHPNLSPEGGVEWWHFYGLLGAKNGQRFAMSGKFWDLQFPWLDLEEEWGFELPEQFTMSVADLENGEYYDYHSGIVIDNEFINTSKMEIFWETNFVQSKGVFVYDLRMENPDDDIVVELTLEAIRYPLPAGWDGTVELTYSNEISNYTYTRMHARGTITIKGEPIEVQGMMGMDHAWYPSVLADQVDFLNTRDNYEWFAVQLSDNTDIVMWKIHNDRGNPAYIPAVSVMRPNGSIDFYEEGDFQFGSERPDIDNLGFYESDESGLIYSHGWEVSLPASDIEFTMYPYMPAQELRNNFLGIQELSIYSAHCHVTGTSGKSDVIGYGIVESSMYYTIAQDPSPVEGLTVTPSSGAVTVEWERSSDPDVTGYRIYVGSSPRAYDLTFDVADTDSFFISGLNNNEEYSFSVTATTDRGRESFFSAEVNAIPNDGETPFVKVNLDLPCFTGGDVITMSIDTFNTGNPAIPVVAYVLAELPNGTFAVFSGDSLTPNVTIYDPMDPNAGPLPISRRFNLPGRFEGTLDLYSLPLDTSAVGANLQTTLYVALVYDSDAIPGTQPQLLGLDTETLCFQ